MIELHPSEVFLLMFLGWILGNLIVAALIVWMAANSAKWFDSRDDDDDEPGKRW